MIYSNAVFLVFCMFQSNTRGYTSVLLWLTWQHCHLMEITIMKRHSACLKRLYLKIKDVIVTITWKNKHMYKHISCKFEEPFLFIPSPCWRCWPSLLNVLKWFSSQKHCNNTFFRFFDFFFFLQKFDQRSSMNPLLIISVGTLLSCGRYLVTEPPECQDCRWNASFLSWWVCMPFQAWSQLWSCTISSILSVSGWQLGSLQHLPRFTSRSSTLLSSRLQHADSPSHFFNPTSPHCSSHCTTKIR